MLIPFNHQRKITFMPKPQRIRDPLHDLIEFGTAKFDQTLWKVIQTEEFQRLRRIKQLGFSEFTYPGATHTRFSHSLGVYHVAKQLLEVVKNKQPDEYVEILGQHALAAALLHDIGHGPFSHAFENVGKRLDANKVKMTHHEEISDLIIRESDIKTILDSEFGTGFASNVADLIKAPAPQKVYGAIVSSQFDADRLDYMQRDRLMAGTHLAGIDFSWLVANLEISEVEYGTPEESLGTSPTFVVGPKAIHAAESYILALFQLYPTVYFHKTTRGVEKLFTELLVRLFSLVNDGDFRKTSLPKKHPLISFALNPSSLSNTLALDDTVISGALSLMKDAKDTLINDLSNRILKRELYKCIDVREQIKQTIRDLPIKKQTEAEHIIEAKIKSEINAWIKEHEGERHRILSDEGRREVYKPMLTEQSPLNQIMVRVSPGKIVDIRNLSPAIKAIPPFEFYRIYYREDDLEVKNFVTNVIQNYCTETDKS